MSKNKVDENLVAKFLGDYDDFVKDMSVSEEALDVANLRICKMCNVVKKRIADGMYDNKNKRWKDENGLLWNGRVCGPCNKSRVKHAMQVNRDKKSSSNS